MKQQRLDSGTVLFEDRFEGEFGDGWNWIQKNDDAWRFHEKALELLNRGDRQAILARDLPDVSVGAHAIEMTLTSKPQPTEQWEQVGFFWFRGGQETFKFVKERIDGGLYVFPGDKPMTAATVQICLIVEGDRYSAHYRPDGRGEYLQACDGELPRREGGDQIAISCFNGPADAEHWVRIDDFRITKLPEA